MQHKRKYDSCELHGYAPHHTLYPPTARTLSGDNTVLNKYRSCLLPRHVQGLICAHNWFHGNDDEETIESKLKESLSSKADSNFWNVSEDEDDGDGVEE
ncbi:hypothetical protein M9H77_12409 [Catharanthus roseus]|uniref:Uncharacterized protein n=1 Tax=Catharanthus roseus TaxID=4058 RepID=A0ACC0BHE2_CATRO|nr:hypothetical protein M9H77_12409 [Catharanthus roseus]